MASEKSIRYLETGSQDPYYNLAFAEFVLTHRLQGAFLLLWQNDNTIVIGRNQNAEAEINRAFVEAHRIHVVRRETGGGAVYHDLGNLNYSFITDAGETQKLEHNDIRWITVDEIDQFVFCPADEEILIRLKQSKGRKD